MADYKHTWWRQVQLKQWSKHARNSASYMGTTWFRNKKQSQYACMWTSANMVQNFQRSLKWDNIAWLKHKFHGPGFSKWQHHTNKVAQLPIHKGEQQCMSNSKVKQEMEWSKQCNRGTSFRFKLVMCVEIIKACFPELKTYVWWSIPAHMYAQFHIETLYMSKTVYTRVVQTRHEQTGMQMHQRAWMNCETNSMQEKLSYRSITIYMNQGKLAYLKGKGISLKFNANIYGKCFYLGKSAFMVLFCFQTC